MKNYRITVNGVAYDVTVEEVGGAEVTAPVVAPAAVAAPAAPKAAPKAAIPAGSASAVAPMPGTIVRVDVKAGDTVKKGDVLVVLEAMKMENDICAPADGKIVAVSVEKGQSVVADEVLVTIA